MKEIFLAIFSNPLSLFLFRLGIFILVMSPLLAVGVYLGDIFLKKFINFLGAIFISVGKIIKGLGKKMQDEKEVKKGDYL